MKPGEKTFLISGVLSLLVLILFYFGIYFLIKDIKKNSEDFLRVKKEISIIQTQIENIESFKNTYVFLKPDLEKVSNLFVDPEVPIDFIKFLETTASSSEVLIKVSLVSPKAIVEEPWSFLEFQLNLTGSIPNFLKFLEKIETANYLIEIQNLSIGRLSEKDLTTKELKTFSLDNVNVILVIRVFTK
jgi:hypothetical protein